MTGDQAITLYALIANFLWLQGNVCLIGNRQYSIHYKSHLIVKKQVILILLESVSLSKENILSFSLCIFSFSSAKSKSKFCILAFFSS